MQKPPGIACHDGLSISTSLGTWSPCCFSRLHDREPTYRPPGSHCTRPLRWAQRQNAMTPAGAG